MPALPTAVSLKQKAWEKERTGGWSELLTQDGPRSCRSGACSAGSASAPGTAPQRGAPDGADGACTPAKTNPRRRETFIHG